MNRGSKFQGADQADAVLVLDRRQKAGGCCVGAAGKLLALGMPIHWLAADRSTMRAGDVAGRLFCTSRNAYDAERTIVNHPALPFRHRGA